jgi:WD40 repeat protein
MMRNYRVAIAIVGLAASVVLSSQSRAQSSFSGSSDFGGTIVPSVTAGSMVQSITDALSSNVSEVLNAKPVIDREKVKVVTGIVIGRAPARTTGKTRALDPSEKSGARGDRMVTAMADGSLGLWDMGSGRELARLRGGHEGAVNAIALSEEAGIIVSAGAGGASQVWRLASGKKLASFKPEQAGAAEGIVVSANGSLAITSYADGTVRLWNTESAEEVGHFKAFRSKIRAVALRSNDTLIVAGAANGKVSVWDVESGEKVLAFKGHKGAVTGIATLVNEERFATVGEDGRVRVWDMETGEEAHGFTAGTAPLRAVARDRSGKRLATGGDDGTVRLFTVDTGEALATLEGHDGTVSVVAFGKDDAVLHTAGVDGTSRIFDLAKGEELVQIVASEHGWAAFNKKDGSFTSEGGADEAVKWASDDVAVNMDQFSSSHLEPSLVSRAAAGAKPPAREGRPQLSVRFAMPPAIAFQTPDEDTSTDDSDFDLVVQAADLGGGIAEIRVYQNGRLVARRKLEEDDVEDEVIAPEFEVELLAGKNEFRVVGLSRDFIESRPAKITVSYSGAQRKSTLHLVTIGINKYRNPALNLNYGVPDANGINEFFKAQPLKLFKEVKIHALFDEDATRSAIEDVMEDLEDTEPQDVVVVYLAGHGDTIGEDWYFMPTEIAYPERPDHVREKGIKSSELDKWVANAPAQKVVMLMDSCKSGAALTTSRGFEERKALSRLARAAGIHVVAAASKSQFAIELESLGHGAFTYALLEGLAGKADRSGDGSITIRELTGYIEDRLPDISEEASGEPQFPVINSKGNDFPLAVGS